VRHGQTAVLALAGRRVDAAGTAAKHFPAENVVNVRRDLEGLFRTWSIGVLVSSAACGADLLALDVARDLRVPSRIILAGDKEQFRLTSVTDRPGEWGPLFDALVTDAETRGSLVIVNRSGEESPYAKVTREILKTATEEASTLNAHFLAVAVWDGQKKRGDDHTAMFLELAREVGATVLPAIDTLRAD
jgi:hypothetical protein